MKDKQHITINIADVAPLDLSIPVEKEALIRMTAKRVNMLWSQLCKEFKGQKTSKEVLAMVAFQFARSYYEHIEKIETEVENLTAIEEALDKILLDVK